MDKMMISNMHVGESGVGKTYAACTFPRWYMISTEPNHHWVWELNPQLAKNKVGQRYFIPEVDTFKTMFKDMIDEINKIKELAKKGEVKTLIIDNLTFLIHNRWLWLNEYQKIINRSGELDTRGMYGNLRTWCYNFMLMNVLNFPGNVVCNAHEMIEGDEALEKKVDKTMVNVPNIMGGFRNDIAGLFSNILFLNKLPQKDGGFKYIARTNKGNGRLAKNRFNLPTIIENFSYQTLIEAIEKSTKGGESDSSVSKDRVALSKQ